MFFCVTLSHAFGLDLRRGNAGTMTCRYEVMQQRVKQRTQPECA